jgi:hypothetical protein
MKHQKVIWNAATKQSYCPVCGRTSDDYDTKKAQLEMEKYDCLLPYVESERNAPGEDTIRLIKKPFKMTLKPERSGSRFVIDTADDGKAVIRLELFHDSAPVLKGLHVEFELLSGTTREQVSKLVEAMNERIVGVIATPDH